MKTIKSCLIAVIIVLFLPDCKLLSQNDSVYNFYMPELSVSQLEKGNKVIYEFKSSLNLFSITDSNFTADPKKYKYSVNIKDIHGVTIKKSSAAGTVIAITFGVGFLLGYGAAGIDFGGGHSVSIGKRILTGIASGLLFGIIGGTVALVFSHDKSYELTKYSYTKKRTELLNILKKNKKF